MSSKTRARAAAGRGKKKGATIKGRELIEVRAEEVLVGDILLMPRAGLVEKISTNTTRLAGTMFRGYSFKCEGGLELGEWTTVGDRAVWVYRLVPQKTSPVA